MFNEEYNEKGFKKSCYMCVHLGELNKKNGRCFCNIKEEVEIYAYCPSYKEKVKNNISNYPLLENPYLCILRKNF